MNMNAYEDIIGLAHHQSEHRPHMTMRERAAQFMPFAALSGYEDEIAEAGRLTDERAEQDESVLQQISGTLSEILRQIGARPEVSGFMFVPDKRKDGGAVESFSGTAKKVDPDRQLLILTDGTEISFSSLIGLEYSVR